MTCPREPKRLRKWLADRGGGGREEEENQLRERKRGGEVIHAFSQPRGAAQLSIHLLIILMIDWPHASVVGVWRVLGEGWVSWCRGGVLLGPDMLLYLVSGWREGGRMQGRAERLSCGLW